MEVALTISELIDLRSFSNIWYWLALAVMWSSASHFVLGVPWDLVARARRGSGQAETDVEVMVRIHCARLLRIGQGAGLLLVGFGFALHSGLLVLGFGYGVEFCQALFLLLMPASLIFLVTLSTAKLIDSRSLAGAALLSRLARLRLTVQVAGFVSIAVTALWGMYVNFTVVLLGG